MNNLKLEPKIAKIWDVTKKEYKFTLEIASVMDKTANGEDIYQYCYIGIRKKQVEELIEMGLEVNTYG